MRSVDGRATTVTELLNPCESRPTSLMQDGIHKTISPLIGSIETLDRSWQLVPGAYFQLRPFPFRRNLELGTFNLSRSSSSSWLPARLPGQLEAFPLIPRGRPYPYSLRAIHLSTPRSLSQSFIVVPGLSRGTNSQAACHGLQEQCEHLEASHRQNQEHASWVLSKRHHFPPKRTVSTHSPPASRDIG